MESLDADAVSRGCPYEVQHLHIRGRFRGKGNAKGTELRCRGFGPGSSEGRGRGRERGQKEAGRSRQSSKVNVPFLPSPNARMKCSLGGVRGQSRSGKTL